MRVKQLEEQIGLPLIDLIGKRLVLTEAGQEALGHAREVAAKLIDLKAAMDQFRTTPFQGRGDGTRDDVRLSGEIIALIPSSGFWRISNDSPSSISLRFS